jgi:ABC-type phosphate transport system substrate-binding protein
MKKLLLGAAVSSALLGGAAHAAISVNADGTPTQATLSNTTQVYLSGSSALQELVERALVAANVQDGICKTGTVRKYQDAGTSGSNQVAYLCELNAGASNNPVLTALSKHAATWKSNLLLYKRNEGGSLQGTVPVANNLSIAFLNVTSNTGTCTPVSSGLFAATVNCDYSSTNNNSHIPDFGISDVEPKIFTVASGNAPTGTANLAAGYKVVPGVAAVFGVVVGTSLRNALQEAQFGVGDACVGSETEACMPSLSSIQIADIFSAYPAPNPGLTNPVAGAGKIHDWKQFKVGSSDLWTNASAAYQPSSSKLHICSRTIGSGTKAQFGVRFLDTACNAAASKIVSQADYVGSNENGGPAIAETAVRPMVHTMASSGGLAECLDELDLDANNTAGSFNSSQYAGKRWAIGIQSLDKNANRSKSYRFIKVDGVAPTIKNVANGAYHDWVESTFLYRTGTNPLKADTLTLVNEIINSFGKPDVLAAVNTSSATHGFGTSGFLAVPNAVHPATATGKVDLTSPVNPLSYAVYPGTGAFASNNCKIPVVYSTPSNNAQGIQLVQ